MESRAVELARFYEQFNRGEISSDLDKLGFLNIGYWKGVSDSIEVAQINLIETLISFFARTEGTILDVACGKGVSTKFLTKYFDPKNITGINILKEQIEICEKIAPECNFRIMDATKLDFADSSADNILCIEAAQHFMTRQRFLEEAYRVLKPEGRLAMHDMVLHDLNHPNAPNSDIWPKENYMPSLSAYWESLSRVGFRHVRVEDISEFSFTALLEHVVRKREREFQRKWDFTALKDAMKAIGRQNPWMPPSCSCCLVFAIK